ncbi:MAG: DJ-1/PfpI family protein [Sphaerochaetaceae bacterium]|nr:DJ-1/PfpI family protein [Sphaerochaetaceae bacterium]
MDVLVILAQGFEEIEALTPIDVLRRAGANVIVAGLTDIVTTGSHGIGVNCNCILKDAVEAEGKSHSFDAVVLPGGMPGAKNLHESSLVEKLIKELDSKKALIAAICASPVVVLEPLGLLDFKNATSYPGMETDSIKVNYISAYEKKVVTDSNVITAGGPGCAMDFAFEIVEYLYGKEKKLQLKKSMVY